MGAAVLFANAFLFRRFFRRGDATGRRPALHPVAFALPSAAKAEQEHRPLRKIRDAFRKFVIVRDDIKAKCDADGIVTLGLLAFFRSATAWQAATLSIAPARRDDL